MFLVAAMGLFVWCLWGYGPFGVGAWLVAIGMWAYPAMRHWFPDWDPANSPLTLFTFFVGFSQQNMLNVVVPHAGNVILVLLHLAAVTSAVRADPFPRARLVTKSSCSSG